MVATLRTWSAAPNVNNLLLLQLTWIGDSAFPGGNGPANSVAVALNPAAAALQLLLLLLSVSSTTIKTSVRSRSGRSTHAIRELPPNGLCSEAHCFSSWVTSRACAAHVAASLVTAPSAPSDGMNTMRDKNGPSVGVVVCDVVGVVTVHTASVPPNTNDSSIPFIVLDVAAATASSRPWPATDPIASNCNSPPPPPPPPAPVHSMRTVWPNGPLNSVATLLIARAKSLHAVVF